MKIFDTKSLQWSEWMSSVKTYLGNKLGEYGRSYGPSQIFGQILSVLNSMTQSIMLYIEDAMTEQNVYTAQRKKSIYSLARLSGYNPSLGSAAKCTAKLTYTAQTSISRIIIPNYTTVNSLSNGLKYNIIMDVDNLVMDTSTNTTTEVTLVEGIFEEQTFLSTGGELYSVNVGFNGDIDVDYLQVWVNGEEYEIVDSLYDMLPEEKQFMMRVALSSGIDLVFGNGQYGTTLVNGDSIKVRYLSHSGELGNISSEDSNYFIFNSSLKDINGDDVDGSSVFSCEVSDRLGVWNGSYSDSTELTKQMIGFNSRGMVLADTNNYKLLLSRYSFIGYNRCWSTPGELQVNALCIKDYAQRVDTGSDYFSLTEDDFKLSDAQKTSISETITDSGMQYSGVTFNFIDPTLVKYVIYVYVRMKSDVIYSKSDINTSIKNSIGEFFSDVYSDIYIPKSDIIYKIKDDISEIDGIDLYLICKENEESDELIGLDEMGNILLDSDYQFPIIKGGWQYGDEDTMTTQDVTITYM